ncbi:putative ribonuclease H protein At1g65750 family [Senna tora]|uniref:Putative ribonuclease H protein At1g65750 family n=1 Tax=Senna tora TaxID=362788 RepID=A0A834TQH1_9FABA|nr:putative ribonuclease H protein At1g65750 family [Senna tora]
MEFSANVDFNVTSDLGKYLGVPILQQRVNKNTYNYILDRVRGKLISWKTNSLSLAGQVTLVRSATSAIRTYSMQTSVIPSMVCNKVDKRNQAFIWGDTEAAKKIHLVSWKHICHSKQNCGLGLRHIKEQNKAFMVKLGWGLTEKKDELWAKVLRAYKCGNNLIPRLWKGIANSWKHVEDGTVWRIGDGRTVCFWSDPGVSNYTLGLIGINLLDSMAANYVTPSGDRIVWRYSKDGSFSSKTAYHAIVNETDSSDSSFWKSV